MHILRKNVNLEVYPIRRGKRILKLNYSTCMIDFVLNSIIMMSSTIPLAKIVP